MKKIILALLLFLLGANPALAVLAVDTTAGPNAGGVCGNNISLTTGGTNRLIILHVSFGTTASGVSVSDTAGLTWTQRASEIQATTGIQEWWAKAPSTLSSDTITVNCTSSGLSFIAIAISGADTTTPFDTNGSVPAHNQSAGSTSASLTISTTNANTLLLAILRGAGSLGTITGPSGFTSVGPATTSSPRYYKIVSSTQSSVAVAYSWTNSVANGYIVDAIQAPAAAATSNMLLDSGL